MIGKYLVNEQYILETSHWLITSRNEHKMTVNFINPGSAVEVKPDGILVWPLGSNQMESWFGRWGSERVKQNNKIIIFSTTFATFYFEIAVKWLKSRIFEKFQLNHAKNTW